MPFLDTRDDARDLRDTAPAGVQPEALFVGRGAMGIEVAQFSAQRPPSAPQLRELHERRQQRRATPVLVVVTHGTRRVALAARFGDEWAINPDLDLRQVERLCELALDAPDRHAADALLRSKLAQLDQPVPGLRNAGLFALHELEHGVPARSDWSAASAAARPLLASRGRELIGRLGYTVEQLPGPAAVLRARGTRLAVAVFLERPDEIEPASERYDGLSPVSYALAKADAEHLDYVVVAAGTVLRVYPVKPGVGTARRGRTETFVELDLALLDDASAGYLTLLASASALAPNGTFAAVLDASRRFAAHLGARLRDRVYEEVMPALARGLVAARRLRSPSRERLQETFDMALLTLFRLLFVAYAEDKELLPYHTSAAYREHSLKQIARRLADDAREGVDYGGEDFYWTEVAQLWKAVDRGNPAWRVPAYDGGLFAGGDGASAPARILGDVTLPDRVFAPALRALLLDETAEDVLGPVDFRALGVREFGTIYEGLLEQELSVAEQDLAVDAAGAYVPARAAAGGRGRRGAAAAEPVVRSGEVYLHDKSGARKASGAYYTKDFAVEHLLERALEPALAEHLARLDAVYDDREAADRFFDFHVADIAMGSGHFLVAAVDHLERGLSGYLAKRKLPGVRDELERLRRTALAALGDDWRGEPIEDTQLLRRQIARRCIHGVDLNPLAVELARLSLWIHTFVPGLPLSFLDANLVVGNALVGVATLDEARELLGGGDDLFSISADTLLGRAREPLARLGKLAEATAAEVKEARALYEKVKTNVAAANDLFTVLAASRVDDELRARVEEGNVSTRFEEQESLFRDRLVRKAEHALAGLRPLHFPVAFPQVFLRRERPGFDVILGNPPWEKLHVEEHEFWARHFPGFRGKTQAERERELPAMRRSRVELIAAFEEERAAADALRNVLLRGPFPGMGSGHPDLYKAFSWRFWHLATDRGGWIGVVLPRAVFAAKGSEEFRKTLLGSESASDVTTLVNNRGWVFENVHPQFSIALAVLTRGTGGRELRLAGPYATRGAFEAGRLAEPARFTYDTARRWSSTIAFPLVPSRSGSEVFIKLRNSPSFGEQGARRWRARPLQGDVNAVTQKEFFDFSGAPNRIRWAVCGGESFDLWTPDTGKRYAVAVASDLTEWLQERRLRSASRAESAFSGFNARALRDPKTLPCWHARISFRDVTRATDSRTMRAALVRPRIFLSHTAPYLVFGKGGPPQEAFVVGVFSTIPFDWYARRFVETHMTFELLSSFPVPLESTNESLAGRVQELSARLAVQNDDRFEEWGAAVGVDPAPLADDEKDDLIHELDAAVAHLYGLDERDLTHIFETFHQGWDYAARLDATLAHFRRLRGR
ncbi:MAG: hypothetical protein WKG32_09380 [Gemmatimonadaceae bacterium]